MRSVQTTRRDTPLHKLLFEQFNGFYRARDNTIIGPITCRKRESLSKTLSKALSKELLYILLWQRDREHGTDW